MANNNFIKQALNLQSPICMDENDGVIAPFNLFNQKNAPFFGGQLSPFYTKEEKIPEGENTPTYDDEGGRWSIKSNKLCYNGAPVKNERELEDSYSREKVEHKTIGYYKNKKGDIYDVFVENILIDRVRQKKYKYNVRKKDGTSTTVGLLETRELTPSFASCIDLGESAGEHFVCVVIAYGPWSTLGTYTFRFCFINLDTASMHYGESETITTKLNHNSCISLYTKDFNSKTYILASVHPEGRTQGGHDVAINAVCTSVLKGAVKIIADSSTGWGNRTIKLNLDGVVLKRYPFIFCRKGIGFLGQPYSADGVGTHLTIRSYSSLKNIVEAEDGKTLTLTCTNAETDVITDNRYQDSDSTHVKTVFTLYPNYYSSLSVIRDYSVEKPFFIPINYVSAYGGYEGRIFCGANTDAKGDVFDKDDTVYRDVPFGIYSNDYHFIIGINNGLVSSVSSSNANLIVNWNSLKDYPRFYDLGDGEYGFFYTDVKGNEWKITRNKAPSIKYILNNRYIIIDSDSEYNVYDIKNPADWNKWSSGYNGTLDGLGSTINSQIEQSELTYGYEYNKVIAIAGAINPNYEVSGSPFISSIFPYNRLLGVSSTGTNVMPYDMGFHAQVDLFISTNIGEVPKYSSTTGGGTGGFVNPDLIGLYYPENVNIIYSVSLLSDYFKTFTNHDFLVENDYFYPVIYSNNFPVLGYFAFSFVENVEGAFVIQNSNFIVSENKIYSVQYNNGSVVGLNAIVNIKGLKYLGANTQMAFFYSYLSKKIYTFTGDILVNELRDANVLQEIYKIFYIPSDNSLLLSCKENNKYCLYFFTSDSNIKLELTSQVENVYNVVNQDKAQIILVLQNGTIKTLSYYSQPNLSPVPIELETAFFGLGQESNMVVDCWYIRLYNNRNDKAEIDLQQNAITNIANKTENKHIELYPVDFENGTHSALIRFQPQQQNVLGAQLRIKSNVPIFSICCSYVPGTTQITTNNAQV